ncbi:hypothetical protein MPL3365_180022 [Mesorhizobium plurifarium]|uniref:Uncharacterized protein n=1 Tax=Mesorhizobium plurifarium TaxID=69974 RepID=A0A090G699_MESPL|nr:hypothetical protein MPL3365_180022 [Mesorhizobium plurifarium]
MFLRGSGWKLPCSFAEIHLSEALHIPDITPRLTIRHHWVRRGMAYPLRPLRLVETDGRPAPGGAVA